MKIASIEVHINDAPECGSEIDREFVRQYRAR